MKTRHLGFVLFSVFLLATLVIAEETTVLNEADSDLEVDSQDDFFSQMQDALFSFDPAEWIDSLDLDSSDFQSAAIAAVTPAAPIVPFLLESVEKQVNNETVHCFGKCDNIPLNVK